MKYWVFVFHPDLEPKLQEVGHVDADDGESAHGQALHKFGRPERRTTLIVQNHREENPASYEEKRENALQLISRSTGSYH